MNRVKSQQKALVSMLSVFIALVLACGTIGTRAEDRETDAATNSTESAEEKIEKPKVLDNNDETVLQIPAEENKDIKDEPEAIDGDISGGIVEETEKSDDIVETSVIEGKMGGEIEVGLTEEETEVEEEAQGFRPAYELEEDERSEIPAGVPEKVAKLLVTSKQYYDETIVEGAKSIPLESNDARYEYITGSPYKEYTMEDRPEWYSTEATAYKRMSAFEVPYWVIDNNGNRTAMSGKITINEGLADSVKCIFSDIFMLEEQFPVNYLVGFMYRKVGGAGLVDLRTLSAHSFGVAIDINNGDYDNDLFVGKGNDLRDKSNPFCISDNVIEVFKAYGWNWGGEFEICTDTMHFQYFGLDFLKYDTDEPFPILSPGEKAKAKVVINIRERLKKLGYLEKASGSKYDDKLVEAVKSFQKDNNLEPDGIVDYETWVPIINQTHDMSYVF
ncbi:MAG: M15 family metallopeptidase [Lachnospiraceae bacterium]|nr:M15 family metallopeptidase [Lachnospiraceae bacterium]